MIRALLVALSIAGCGEPAPVGGARDLAVPAEDLTAPRGRIGDPCRVDSDCGEGLSPLCFVDAVSGFAPAKTPGGYCSSACAKTPFDCGPSALCMWFGFAQPYCFRSCALAADCRAGYACLRWMAPVCFPSRPFLDCDPTAGDGSCTTADGRAGGCYRLASGDGLSGRCGARCDIGPGHCAPDPTGAPLRCREINDTLDASGAPTRDRWRGPVCEILSSEPTKGGCLYGWSNPILNYATACADGWDCASQFDPLGDEDCRELCYLDGGAPAADGGAPLQCKWDGGCADVFRVGDAVNPSERVGLCPQGP